MRSGDERTRSEFNRRSRRSSCGLNASEGNVLRLVWDRARAGNSGPWSTSPGEWSRLRWNAGGVHAMSNIIYVIGFVVVIVAVLGFLGLR